MHDLIVVGGGAVGLFLSKEFAKKGKSVLLLERKKEIGQKLCSGLVSSNILNYIPKDDFGFFLEKEINGAKLWIEKSPFFFKGKAFLFDRNKFDIYLKEEAEKYGVKILTEESISNISEKEDFVEISSTTGSIFRGKILAGCDGAVSLIARNVNLPQQKKLLLGLIVFSEKKKDVKEDFVELFFSKKFSGFFAWKIPRKKSVEWGIALKKDKNPREKLEIFLKEKKIPYKDIKAALIPYFPIKKTITKRVFLCGDSAGQIKPYTGGGLVYGFSCAKIASNTIDNFENPNLEEYEKKWRKFLMKEIRTGDLFRKFYSLPNFAKKIGLSLIRTRQKLDQDKPTSIFRF
ncbi:MAG: NAD(P)/FAD-dependent oxidoreductase [Candidatus Pacebacteria bacterium]|nr:NAD(P)/FAD-dependent oxidoreductase [Candidatus Paceibacterota bacterium]